MGIGMAAAAVEPVPDTLTEAARMKVLLAHNRYRHRGEEDAVFDAEAAILRKPSRSRRTWSTTRTCSP